MNITENYNDYYLTNALKKQKTTKETSTDKLFDPVRTIDPKEIFNPYHELSNNLNKLKPKRISPELMYLHLNKTLLSEIPEDYNSLPLPVVSNPMENTGSCGASTCLIVFMRVLSQTKKIYTGSVHISTDDYFDKTKSETILTQLKNVIEIKISADRDNVYGKFQLYVIGGETSSNNSNDKDYDFDTLKGEKNFKETIEKYSSSIELIDWKVGINERNSTKKTTEYIDALMTPFEYFYSKDECSYKDDDVDENVDENVQPESYTNSKK